MMCRVRLMLPATAMLWASPGSVLRPCPVSNTRTRADSLGGTSKTASPFGDQAAAGGALTLARADLYAALTGFNGGRAHELTDELFAGSPPTPSSARWSSRCLADVGDGWERGAVTIAQEHFASNLLRERLLGLTRPWDRGAGRRTILACPPDERQDIALICFGLVPGATVADHLSRRGHPIGTLAEAADALEPNLVVCASIMDGRLVPYTSTGSTTSFRQRRSPSSVVSALT